MNDWIPLGLNLGVEISTLEAIEREHITIGERRTQMLNEWQKQVTPTWSAVLQALVKMGMRYLAIQLAQKKGSFMLMEVNSTVVYHIFAFFHSSGIPVPKPSKGEVFEQLQNLPQREEVRMINTVIPCYCCIFTIVHV